LKKKATRRNWKRNRSHSQILRASTNWRWPKSFQAQKQICRKQYEERTPLLQKAATRSGSNCPIAGSDTISDLYGGVEALPSSFYIDRNGRIIQQVSGLISYGDMERNIKKALESPPPSTASSPAS